MNKIKIKKISKKNHQSSPSSRSTTIPNTDIFKIFTEVQWTEAFHEKYIRQLTKVYENTPFRIFVDDFINCLKKVFISNDRNIEKNVELTLDFASKFIVSVIDPESEETNPFLTKVFNFLFDIHDCYDTAVRLHCCQFINCLLNSLGPNASLDVDLCENISLAMMERLQDKVASVRTQAVFALHRLQDPSDPNCKIIEVFLYHMTRDPSPEVRCAVINNVVIVQRVLTMILSRINDCKDDVRRDAYVVCSKVSVQKFRIKQRQMMLSCGFLDPSDKVQAFVKNKLLRKWLSTYNNDYAHFLRALNVQSEIGLEVATKSLLTIFSQEEKCELVEYLLNRMKQKTIPFDSLNSEIVLFWRILAEYLQPPRDSEVTDEFFEKIMPDLTYFSDYIKGFFTSYNFSGSSTNDDDEAKSIEKEFILMQLLEMTKCYDLADEFGRKNFSKLCVILLKDPQVTIKSVPIIINRLSWAMPDVTERIAAIVELISDLREPFFDIDTSVNNSFGEMQNVETRKTQLLERLKILENERLESSQMEDLMISREIENEIANIEKKLADLQRKSTDIPFSQSQDENIDPLVATKVLKIINEMIDSRDITRLTPTLRSLFDNVVLPSFKKNMQNATVTSLSLETFGLFCLLDPDLARERFIIFCFLISNGSLTVPALKAVFDLLQKYGLKMFSLKDGDEMDVTEDGNRRKSGNTSRVSVDGDNPSAKYVIPLLYSLLDSDSIEVRNVTASGLCKLLLIGHIRSHSLVAKLISLWFNPIAAEDPPLRQMLSLFFKSFVKVRGAQFILEKAFLPTLQIFFDASPDDPLSEIDVDNVARLLINLTDPEFGSCLPKGYYVHTHLAELICNELLQNSRNSREKNTVLIKVLSLLTINSTDIDLISKLVDKAETLKHKYKSMGEKNCQRYAVKFSVRLSTLKRDMETKLAESEICNTLSTTTISEKKSEVSENTSGFGSKNVTTSSEVVTEMDVDDVGKKENTIVAKIEKRVSPDSDVSDSDSVISGKSNYSRYHRKKVLNEDDLGIVIPSSDEDEDQDHEEEELQKVNVKVEKGSLKSGRISTAKKVRSKKIDSSVKKRGVNSCGLSHSSLQELEKKKINNVDEKRGLRSCSMSISSQGNEEIGSQTASHSVKKRNIRSSSSQSSLEEMDIQPLSDVEEKESLSSSSSLISSEIGSQKISGLVRKKSLRISSSQSSLDEIEDKNVGNVKVKRNLRSSSSLSLTSQEEIGSQKSCRSVKKKVPNSSSTQSSTEEVEKAKANKIIEKVKRGRSTSSSQSSQFDSPASTTFSSPSTKGTPVRTRYNTRSVQKVKK